ncbi:uroporphyrinogen-III synthase [Promicromonospora sp. NPDC050249]|uniref:uroporphyrinogen-III synthase n=1 Tax=Promicromonospora sp. NPDC050249 TaxID=3154743 RepID=UPI0033C0DD7C
MTGAVLPTEPADSAGHAAVLVARAPARAAGLLALLRERGLDAVAAPVIERAPVEDHAELDDARERLARGAYDWVAVTSVNAVDALLGPTGEEAEEARGDTTSPGSVAESRQRLLRATHSTVTSSPPDDTPSAALPAGTPDAADRTPACPVRWAAVGPATRQALIAHGLVVDLVPEVATGAGLADAFPVAAVADATTAGNAARAGGHVPRVLLPLGNLASDTMRAGLEAKGWTVDVVTVYRTVTRELPPELRRPYDVVVVASGSAARQVAAQLGPQRVVAIGEPSARAAGAVGHTVLATAAEPTDEALAVAVAEALVSI